MGEVYRAHDEVLDREVAVKVLHEEVASDSRRLERFEREAKAVAKLSHPNILEIYDFGTEDGIAYAVTELLEGESLRDHVARESGPLPWQRVCEIGAAVADGLAAAHSKGVVHRDLKPANLFLTLDGRVKILDFGLARTVRPAPSEDDATETVGGTLTDAGTVLGTVGYMAPEQVLRQEADERSDVFSLGCVLYEMVSGRRAFDRDSGPETMVAILKERPRDLSESGVALPVDLENAIERCLEKKPEARFQSAADLAYGLRSIGSGSEYRLSRPAATPRTVTSERAWLAVAAAVLLTVVAFVVWRLDYAPAEPEEPGIEIVPNRIAVVPFENRTGDPSLDPIGVLAADRIAKGLAEVTPPWAPGFEAGPDMVPVDRIRELLATGSPASAAGVARATGARTVVTGFYVGSGVEIELDATVTDTASNSVVYVFEPLAAPRDAPGDAIAILKDRVYMVVTDHLSPYLGAFADEQLPKIDAYRMFVSSQQLIRAGQFEKAMALVPQMLQLEPDFNRIRCWMLMPGSVNGAYARALIDELKRRGDQLTENQLLFVQAKEAELAANRETAHRIWWDLVKRAPDNPMLRSFAMVAAFAANRPAETVDLFERFEGTIEDGANPALMSMLVVAANAYHLLDRYEEELATARRLREVLRESLDGMILEARALVGLVRMDELDALLSDMLLNRDCAECIFIATSEVILELRRHGHRDASIRVVERALSWYESSELEHTELGNPHGAESLAVLMVLVGRANEGYESLLATIGDAPESPGKWMSIARAAAWAGDFETAREMAGRLEKAEGDAVPGFVSAYIRARLAALLGERDEAIRLLRESIVRGLGGPNWFHRPTMDWYWILHRDPDFESLWGDPEFQEIVRPKG